MSYYTVTPKRTPSITPSTQQFTNEYEWYYQQEIKPLIKMTHPKIKQCLTFLYPTKDREKTMEYKFKLPDGTFQGVFQMNGWKCDGSEMRFNLASWQKQPIFAKVEFAELQQFKEVYEECLRIFSENEKISSIIDEKENVIQTIEIIIQSCSNAMRLLQNKQRKGLFPEYNPSIIFQKPKPPSNCIFEIYVEHAEIIFKVYGLEFKSNENVKSTSSSASSIKLSKSLKNSSLFGKSPLSLLTSSQAEETPQIEVEWGYGEGKMGNPNGTQQVIVQNKYSTVCYLYKSYDVTVMAKREVHISIDELDTMYNDLNSLFIQWSHVLSNLKQLL